jgi:ABC-type multidrug transport system fused ATPase/permease subunit
VFDEATSALDNITEREVMEAIDDLSTDLTVLIIAHRLSTLKNCGRIIELGNSGIKRIGSYEEMVGKND